MARKAMALTRTNPYPTDLVRILGGGSCNDAGGWDQSPQKTMTHVQFSEKVSRGPRPLSNTRLWGHYVM